MKTPMEDACELKSTYNNFNRGSVSVPTDLLKSRNLLLINPHFKVFIRDQAMLIRPHFNNVFVLMPFPRFSNVALLPYFGKNFSFSRLAADSYNKPERNFTMISPRYFTLPIEALRKRNCYLAARSCVKTFSKRYVNINLMHAHFMDYGFVGAALKSLLNRPFVVTAHGGDVYEWPFRDKWHRTLAKYVLSEADQIITVSRFNEAKLLSLGVSPNKLHVIPNGYDDKLFRSIPLVEARKKLGLPLNKKILLSVGNLVAVKGHTYLLDAMKFVLKKRDDVILVIVGSGALGENLRKKTREFGLEGKVLFVGQRNHEEIPVWINACDIFVLPSLSEGFPTVIPEALACGKPVVGTNVGGVSEILHDSEVGLLVKPKDTDSLALGINEALHKNWHSRVIRRYAEQYSWKSLVPDIISVYKKVLYDQ